MATVARSFTSAVPRVSTSVTSSLPSAAHSRPSVASFRTAYRSQTPREFFPSVSHRWSSAAPSPKWGNKTLYIFSGAAISAFAAGYLLFRTGSDPKSKTPEALVKQGRGGQAQGLFTPSVEDYQSVYNAVAKKLWEQDDYDDGSYGPVVLRLAWHASGTYDKETGTGGSNGATMRFAPESEHGANNGMKNARDFLESIKEEFPWISYSDLWTLAAVCAVQEMQGPVIPWRPGRQDHDPSYCTPDGRLPDGGKGYKHLRDIFGRMGFNDEEIVALSGAHALGRCHEDRSGFEGPWTFSPTVLTNDYYKLLMEEKWDWREWSGAKQYQDVATKSLMMLPTDMALIQDPIFKKQVKVYADDSEAFFNDFANVVIKLFELGVPFTTSESDRIQFKTYDEQGFFD